ncbi:hypothetical protein BDZ97DRAFT_1771741, partial [Flammula alnicola]
HFQRLRGVGDIDKSIIFYADAVQLTSKDDSQKVTRHFGFVHLVRIEHVGDLGDLDKSVSALKSAVHETRWIDSNFDSPEWWIAHALELDRRAIPHDAFEYYVKHFNQFDVVDFAQLALAIKDTADRLISHNISQDNVRLHSLGLLLEARLKKMGDFGEITELVLATPEDAARRLPDTYPKKESYSHVTPHALPLVRKPRRPQ